jgi:hypothetical protein
METPITVEVDLGFSFKFTNSFRLLRINCPEVRGESREEGCTDRVKRRTKNVTDDYKRNRVTVGGW